MWFKRKTSLRPRLLSHTSVSHRGGAWFVIGILLSLFMGGAVRVLLSERQIRHWVQVTVEKKAPHLTIVFDSASVQLSEGWWPRFGIIVKELHLTSSEKCQQTMGFSAHQAFFPLSLGQLFHRQLKMGVVDLKGVTFRTGHCPPSLMAVESGDQVVEEGAPQKNVKGKGLRPSPVLEVLEPRDSLLQFFAQSWPGFLQDVQQWIEGVEIHDGMILGWLKDRGPIEIPHGTLRLSPLISSAEPPAVSMASAIVTIQLQIIPGTSWIEAVGHEPISLYIKMDQETNHFNVELPVREGQLIGSGSFNLRDFQILGHLQLADVPVTQIVEAATSWGVVTDHLQPRRLWMNGEIAWEGKLTDLKSIELIGRGLKIMGEGGSVMVHELKMYPFSQPLQYSPFVVEFQHLALRQLLETLGRKGYTGVMSSLGYLNGSLRVENSKQISFIGNLVDMEFQFSRQSVRARQRLEKLGGNLVLKGDRIYGNINEINLFEGKFQGSVTFQMDRKLLNGDFQIQSKGMEFHPDVQKVMMGGTMSPLLLSGAGELVDGQLSQWRGEAGAAYLTGQGWSVDHVKVRSEFKDHHTDLSVKIAKMKMEDDHTLLSQLRPMLKDFNKGQKSQNQNQDQEDGLELQLKNFSTKLEVHDRRWSWKNATATATLASAAFVGRDFLLLSLGTWTLGDYQGQVQIQPSHGQSQKSVWGLSGRWPHLQVEPMTGFSHEP